MEELHKLNVVRNSEIRFRWLRLNLRGKVESAVSGALEFVTEQGCMKFVRPIYRFVTLKVYMYVLVPLTYYLLESVVPVCVLLTHFCFNVRLFSQVCFICFNVRLF